MLNARLYQEYKRNVVYKHSYANYILNRLFFPGPKVSSTEQRVPLSAIFQFRYEGKIGFARASQHSYSVFLYIFTRKPATA